MNKPLSLTLYWKCQLIGWSLASLYWGFTGFIDGRFDFLLGFLQFITDVVLYILLTHLYRNFSIHHQWQNSTVNQLVKRIIPAIVVMGTTYMVITVVKVYLFRCLFIPGYAEPFLSFWKANGLNIFIAGIRLMSIWILAYQLYHYAQREINTNKENARLAMISKDAQLDNLSAQLNPHFLFNSLNTIKALIMENPGAARRAVDLLSDLLRSGLYQTNTLLTTVNEELDLVRDYLELEKLRMEERLAQSIEIDNVAGEVLILRLSLQTLVENAVKHGISRQKEGGLVEIKISGDNGLIKITVRNPGQLDKMQSPDGIGLKNLRERLDLQYKGKAEFEINGQPEGTITATLLIPVR
jgi:sensor histidine kinase YesM